MDITSYFRSIVNVGLLGHFPLMTPMTQPLVMNDVIYDVIGNTPLTHSYSYTVGLGLTRGASSCARAARSMTSALRKD